VREFPLKLIRRLIKRVFFKYFVYDFNMASVYILAGVPMLMFGLIFGGIHWVDSILGGGPKTAGTIMLAALPVILAFQMLLQAVQIDIHRTPRGRDDYRGL
jgi:dolichol-phosphate mannosyltransferase